MLCKGQKSLRVRLNEVDLGSTICVHRGIKMEVSHKLNKGTAIMESLIVLLSTKY